MCTTRVGPDQQIIFHGERGKHAMSFQYLDHAGTHQIAWTGGTQVAAVKFDASRLLFDQAGNRVQGRALPRSVTTQHHDEFSLAYGQGNAVYHFGFAVGNVKVFDFEQWPVASHVKPPGIRGRLPDLASLDRAYRA